MQPMSPRARRRSLQLAKLAGTNLIGPFECNKQKVSLSTPQVFASSFHSTFQPKDLGNVPSIMASLDFSHWCEHHRKTFQSHAICIFSPIPFFQFSLYFIAAAAATDLSGTNVSINKLKHFAVLPIHPDKCLVSGLFSSFLCDDMKTKKDFFDKK